MLSQSATTNAPEFGQGSTSSNRLGATGNTTNRVEPSTVCRQSAWNTGSRLRRSRSTSGSSASAGITLR